MIAFPIVIAIFIILGILVLRKDSEYWGNRFFALFFWITALGLLVNLPVVFLEDPSFSQIITTLRFTSLETINIALFTLLLGILVVYKGEGEIVQRKIIVGLLAILAIVIIGQILIPSGFGILIPSLEPKWSIPFGIYEFVISQALIILTFYFARKLYLESSEQTRPKFMKFLIGVGC